MREVKFRGRRKSDNKLIDGSLISGIFCSCDENLMYILDANEIEYECWGDIAEQLDELEVEPNSVAQYTGLNDIDGNEIYEGDTIHQIAVLLGSKDIDFTGTVIFIDGSWMIANIDEGVFLFNETCENTIIND